MPAEALCELVRAHVDAVHDYLRRQGCSARTAPGVVESSALELVASAAAAPATVPALLGRWFALAGDRARCDEVAGRPLADPDQELLRAGLARRSPTDRAALLLSDGYGLADETVAAGLRVDPDEAARQVGRARLALLPDVYAGDEPVPAGHVDGAALARLAAGRPGRADGAAARHLRDCVACEAALHGQQDVRQLLAGLALVALPGDGREALLERVAVRARGVLPAVADDTGQGGTPRRALTAAPVALSLLLATLLGVGLGALLSRPAPPAQARVRALPPVAPPSATPLPGDVPRSPDPAPSTLVFTYPPNAPVRSVTPSNSPGPPSATPSPTGSAAPPGTLLLSPASGPAGSSIRVTGTGWTAGGSLRVVLVDPLGRATVSTVTVTVGAGGRFQASLIAGGPGARPGGYRVDATENGVTAHTPFRLG